MQKTNPENLARSLASLWALDSYSPAEYQRFLSEIRNMIRYDLGPDDVLEAIYDAAERRYVSMVGEPTLIK